MGKVGGIYPPQGPKTRGMDEFHETVISFPADVTDRPCERFAARGDEQESAMQRPTDCARRFTAALPGLAVHCSILQASSSRFRQFRIDEPAVILVRRGWKRVITDHQEIVAAPGEAVFVPQGLECVIVNGVGETGAYHAEALGLTPSLVAAYADPAVKPTTGAVHIRPDGGFLDALARARQTIAEGASVQESIHRHVLGELVIRLQALGIGLLPDMREHLVWRIRALVRTDPAADWPAANVAGALAMSEQTLRRKLALLGTSLTEIIADVRMTTALALLQASELPINRVALDVGYGSASKFAARFRARFGLSPRDIRSAANISERSGTEIERPRAAAE